MKYFLYLFLLLGLPLLVHAEEQQNLEQVRQQLAAWLDQSLANRPGKASYQIGHIDSRLPIAPCRTIRFSIPQGHRLEGHTLIRAQCTEGAAWGFNIPVRVGLYGTYYVAARPLADGQVIKESDLIPQQGDLASLPGTAILDPVQAIGRTLNAALSAGAPLREEMLRTTIVIQQSQKVRILFKSNGMEVANEGIALNNAAAGMAIRVKISNGQTVIGTARADGIVEVGP